MKSMVVYERFVILVLSLFLFLICSCGGSGEKVETKSEAANQASYGSATPANNVSAIPSTSPAIDQTAKAGPEGAANTGKQPTSKDPQPQIGTGGNDFFLFTKARAALSTDDELKRTNIIIDVKGGTLTLSGVVRNAGQKLKAEQLVRAIEGVKEVKNQLRISA